MSTSSTIERRTHLRAYAYGKICTVTTRGLKHRVDLIDISPGGSRLRFTASNVPALDQNEVITLSCDDPSLSGLLNAISAEVRWKSPNEIGVRFLDELPMGTSDIQRLITLE